MSVFLTGAGPIPFQSGILPIGGRIFYDNGDNGATYKFYDSSMNELTNQTVSGLANAVYYTVRGTVESDRWYVYDNTTHTDTIQGKSVTFTGGLSSDVLCGGYYNTTTGVTSNTIGSGKTNTQTVVNMGVPTDYTPNIWGYIKYCIDNRLNGCDDWFIASTAEQEQLRSSALVTWYNSNYIWASVEHSSTYASRWHYGNQYWSSGKKSIGFCAFACRSF